MKLDIGCAENKKPGYIGVDVNPGKQVDYIMDVQKLDFDNNSVEEVFSRRCIQHVKDDNKALAEILRVLKPNGTFTLEVASWYGWLFYHMHLSASYGKYKVFHLYLTSRIKKKLRQVGFTIVQSSHIPSPRGVGYDIQIIAKK